MTNGTLQPDDWFQQIANQTVSAHCLTIGLINGHRDGTDFRAIHRVVSRLANEMMRIDRYAGLLLCRLAIHRPRFGRLGMISEDEVEPAIEPSNLGRWSQIEIPVTLGLSASWTMQQIPRWLPNWKRQFRLIVVDLGPIHLVSSRMVGRLCDSNYLMIGPNSSASPEWLMQYVDYHAYSGSNIAGTLVTQFAA